MKVNESLSSSKKANSQNTDVVSNGAISNVGNISLQTPNQTDGVGAKRQLAWQVASNLLVSFKYAWAGLLYAFKTQRNFRIHLAIGALAIGFGIFLHLKPVEMTIICLTSGLVLVMELLNTAIESVVDLTVKQTYHELAKIAKDCAAGAVLVSAMASVLVAGFLLVPPLLLAIGASDFRF
jgi:diacylglycerol kinase (ATP)